MFRRSVKNTVFEKRGPDSCAGRAGTRDGTWGETGAILGAGTGGARTGAGAEIKLFAVDGAASGSAVTGASTGAGEGTGRQTGLGATNSGAGSDTFGIIEEIEYRAGERRSAAYYNRI